jgi:agmatinase
MKEERYTFLGCESKYKDSRIAVFGAPFDSTSSFRPGSRFAPMAMRNDSFGIETYSPYQDKDMLDIKVFDGGDLELPFGNTEKSLQMIEKYADEIVGDGKIPFMIGGEHLVTLGAFKAVLKKYPDICVVHFDAHPDLRDNYLGEKLSHASVLRRIHDLIGDDRIFQYGMRSGDKGEFLFAKDHTRLTKFNFDLLKDGIKEINNRPVYFTIDLDVLDPALFCGTGTPEAGGVSFKELLDAINEVTKANVVGLDMVELSPSYDSSGVSTATACKLLRELVLQIY